jgi:hypothetical protein
MMLLLPPIDAADRVYSIDTDAASAGSVSANFFAGFDHPAGKIFTPDGTTQKAFTAPNTVNADITTGPVLTTKAQGRDQEFTGWAQVCRVYLRYANGRAVLFNVNPVSNEFAVSFVEAITTTGSNTYGTGQYNLQSIVSLSSLIPGYSANVNTDLFTVGCEGKSFYAKYNGTTFWTGEFWQHVVPGKIMMQTNATNFGFRDVTCTFPTAATSLSDFDNKIVDPRDWGFKALTTTGSMSAASTTLTVASNPGFAIGDKIIVEIGGEAGLGELGTKGVGGTWPRYSYANEAALPNATTWRATTGGGVDGYVWLEDTGKVWINFLSGGVTPTWGNWTDTQDDRTWYYTRYVAPRALRTTITNISGTTFTVADASVVATTNANVYYDCSDAVTDSLCVSDTSGLGNNRWVDGVTYRMPSGTFAMAGIFDTKPGTTWTIEGAGRASTILYSPKGTVNISFLQSGANVTIQDFKMRGWAGLKYWNGTSDTTAPLTDHCIEVAITTLYGGIVVDGGTVRRVDMENVWGAPKLTNRVNGLVSDCDAVHNNGNQQSYRTWFFQHVYCQDTWYEDCNYTADNVATAYELFGALGGGMRNCTSVNGLVASNSSGGGYTFENMDVTVDCNDWPTNGWLAQDGNAFNINLNIGPGGYVSAEQIAEGGSIVNPAINMTKRTSDGFMPFAITINTASNISITGTHTAKPGVGEITMSNYDVADTSDTAKGAVGIVAEGASATVTGIRVIGTAAGGGTFSNISLRNATSTVSDCVGDEIQQFVSGSYVDRLGTNGNITNAAYEALP